MRRFESKYAKFFLFLFFININAYTQVFVKDAVVPAKASSTYTNTHTVLYLTTDKTIYTPGEVIWFAGYLLSGIEISDSLAPNILSVGLLRTDGIGYALRKNYYIGQGLCAGSMQLPDSISPGVYHLIASANLLDTSGRPLYTYRSTITIKSAVKPSFATSFSINDSVSADTVYVSVQATLANGQYAMGKSSTITYHLLNKKPQTAKLSITGNTKLAIPVSELDNSNYFLYTATTFDKTTRYYNLQLPPKKGESLKAKFYSGRATLNSTGAAQQSSFPDSAFGNEILKMNSHLPTNDTLSLFIKNEQETKIKLAIESMRDTLSQVSNIINIQGERTIKIPLNNLSRGLYSISLLNNRDSALAQKLFFAHSNKKNTVAIETEKAAYSTREKVKVSITLKDAEGNRQRGVFTAYCVLFNRIEPDKKQNIESYYNFDYWLGGGRISYSPQLYKNKDWLENRLAASGISWRKKDIYLGQVHKLLPIGGVLRKDKKSIKDSLSLMTYGGATFSVIKADKNGEFFPNVSSLVVSEGNPFWIKVMATGAKNTSDYSIEVKDPMKSTMQKVLIEKALPAENIFLANQTSMQQVLDDSLASITLEPVIVKAGNRVLSDAAYGNKCGDFVCEGGVLNCDHRSGGKRITLPIIGHSYDTRIPSYPYYRSVVYQGCTEDNINPIYASRRFEGMDSIKLADTDVHSYLSTIYWNPFVMMDKDSSTMVSFYTSDLPGKYKIVIEGVDEKGDVFYQDAVINVSNNNNKENNE